VVFFHPDSGFLLRGYWAPDWTFVLGPGYLIRMLAQVGRFQVTFWGFSSTRAGLRHAPFNITEALWSAHRRVRPFTIRQQSLFFEEKISGLSGQFLRTAGDNCLVNYQESLSYFTVSVR